MYQIYSHISKLMINS